MAVGAVAGWATAESRSRCCVLRRSSTPCTLVADAVELAGDEAVVRIELHGDGNVRAHGTARWRRLRR